MNQIGWDVVAVLAIMFVGGFFAAAEMAIVSLREGQVHSLEQRGKRGRRAAKLAQDPNRFLSAVQIGVTAATLFSGTFAEATLAADLRSGLLGHGLSPGWASALSLITVTVVVSYFSLVLAELAPKRLALQRPEQVATLAAPTLDRISVLARPLVWLLSRSTNLVVRLLGGDPRVSRGIMTEEELHDLVAGHQALSADERRIVSEVFDAGKRQLREVLVPRTEVEFLDAATPLPRAAKTAAGAPYSRFPVYQDSYDNVVGFIHARDLLDPDRVGTIATVGELRRPVKMLPISKTVLSALSEMRRDRSHLAIVVDEYGGTAGIVTLEDLVEELVGEIQDEYDVEAGTKQLIGGAMEVDGLLNLDEFAEQTGLRLPEGPYETVAGYVLAVLGRLPTVGDAVEAGERRLTVTELDGRRIARLRVGPSQAATGTITVTPPSPGQPPSQGQSPSPGQPPSQGQSPSPGQPPSQGQSPSPGQPAADDSGSGPDRGRRRGDNA